MIATLRGTLIEKSPTEIVVDVAGIGFVINVPLSTFETLGNIGETVSLLTHFVVREDAFLLFGFMTKPERNAFRLLISVNGIGPKVALSILSGINVDELRQAIGAGDTRTLTNIPGVGRKLADRIVIELRDKVNAMGGAIPAGLGLTPTAESAREEAIMALISLGHNRVVAEKTVRTVIQDDPATTNSLEALIKAALRKAQR